jgi:YVTN family beta-propeller protein
MSLVTLRRYCGRARHLAQGWLLPGMLLIALPLSARTVRIYVTNSAGDNVHVIDPETDKVVQVIEGIEVPHDVNFSRDGSQVYVSNESENVLDVVDQKSGKIIKKVALSGRPNMIAVTKDGGRVFVAIRSAPGALDIIDSTSLERVRSIPIKPVHDVYLTPDGKYMVAGSQEAKLLTVIDVQTEKPVWEINFDNEVRTMAFETGRGGLTRRIFVNTSLLHGFEVVDFAKRKVVATIRLPDEPGGGRTRDTSPSHGMGVAPDNKTLWVDSKYADGVFVYSLPDLKLLGHALTGEAPEWLTFTPDGKKVYVSALGDNAVSAIDAKTLREVARIPVGQAPERNNTLVLP